jgi:hypothetical protein
MPSRSTAGTLIKIVRTTARAQFYGLFTAAGERIGAAEFKSAIAAAKAHAAG